MSNENNLNTAVTIYQKSFEWKITGFRLDNEYSQLFNLDGMNLKIHLFRGYDQMEDQNGVKFKKRYLDPIFCFENIPQNFCKFVKVVITTSKGNAVSYLPYTEVKLGKQSFNQINYRFLDIAFVKRCLEHNFTLTMRIDVSVKNAPHHQNFDKSFKLAKDLRSIFNDDKFADFTFNVGGRDFPVHKAMVNARSPVLRSIFIENESEGMFLIEDIEADVFSSFLHFIYTDNIPNLNLHFVKLLAAAYRFDIDDLKNICEEESMARLDCANATEIFKLANLYNCGVELKQAAFKIIQLMFEKINMKMPECFIDEPEKVLQMISLLSELKEKMIPISPKEAVTSGRVTMFNKRFEKKSGSTFKFPFYGYNRGRKFDSKKPRNLKNGEASAEKLPADRKEENRSEVSEKPKGDAKKRDNGSGKFDDRAKKLKDEAKATDDRLGKYKVRAKKKVLKKRKDYKSSEEPENGKSEVAEDIKNGNSNEEDCTKGVKNEDKNVSKPVTNGNAKEPAPIVVGITVPPTANEDYNIYLEKEDIQDSNMEKPKFKDFQKFMASVSDD